MFEIEARTRFLDLSKSLKSLYIVAIGVFLSILTYVVYQNLVVTVTMSISTILAYIILSQPPEKIQVKINEQELVIGKDKIAWESLVAWAMVDLGDDLEFVMHSSGLVRDYYYFYISRNNPQVKEFLQILTQFLPYDENVVFKNKPHTLLRNFGLK